MARSLENKPNVNAPDDDYPYGRIRNKTAGVNGTPVNEDVYGDFHQFFAKMFAESGLTYNELPDNEYSGFQYFEALGKLSIYRATSNSSLAIGAGSKAFTIGEGFAFATGNRVRATDASNSDNFIEGEVTSYTEGVLTINADLRGGSGTKNSWNINLGSGGLTERSWTSISTSATDIDTIEIKYKKDSCNNLAGSINISFDSPVSSLQYNLATLPVGYRPGLGASLVMPLMSNSYPGTPDIKFARIVIAINGVITIYLHGTSTDWNSFNGTLNFVTSLD